MITLCASIQWYTTLWCTTMITLCAPLAWCTQTSNLVWCIGVRSAGESCRSHKVRCLHLTVIFQWKVFIFTPTGGKMARDGPPSVVHHMKIRRGGPALAGPPMLFKRCRTYVLHRCYLRGAGLTSCTDAYFKSQDLRPGDAILRGAGLTSCTDAYFKSQDLRPGDAIKKRRRGGPPSVVHRYYCKRCRTYVLHRCVFKRPGLTSWPCNKKRRR